jgi:hypothetical protein
VNLIASAAALPLSTSLLGMKPLMVRAVVKGHHYVCMPHVRGLASTFDSFRHREKRKLRYWYTDAAEPRRGHPYDARSGVLP